MNMDKTIYEDARESFKESARLGYEEILLKIDNLSDKEVLTIVIEHMTINDDGTYTVEYNCDFLKEHEIEK